MYKKRRMGWLKHLDFILIDLVCLQIAFVLAYLIRIGDGLVYTNSLYRDLAAVLTIMQILVSVVGESFKGILRRGKFIELMACVKHTGLIMLLAILYLFSYQRGEEVSRLTLYLTGLFFGVITYAVRLFWKSYLIKRLETVKTRRVLIVTTTSCLEEVYQSMKKYRAGYIQGIALVDDDSKTGTSYDRMPIVAGKEDVLQYAVRAEIEEVLVVSDNDHSISEDLIGDFVEIGITVHIKIAQVADNVGSRQFVEKMGEYTVLTTSINTMETRQYVFKRILDIIGGLVGCLITGILFLVLGPIIYVKSPGPIFFSQIRVGRFGKKFKIYKFRSMYLDAEERKKELMAQNRVSNSLMFKLDFDPRIIGAKKLDNGKVKKGIGNIIRDWSLDEFPQFFNVLKGEMSLVGTRPPTVDEWEQYELHHNTRLAIKPGITGMWQVSGRSKITDFEEVVQLDKKYILEWRISLDLKILAKTVLIVLKQDGSM